MAESQAGYFRSYADKIEDGFNCFNPNLASNLRQQIFHPISQDHHLGGPSFTLSRRNGGLEVM